MRAASFLVLACLVPASGQQDPAKGAILNSLGSVYRDRGDNARAETCYRRSIAQWDRVPGLDPAMARPLNDLAALYLETRQASKAARLVREPLALRLQSLDAVSVDLGRLFGNLGLILMKQHRYSEAAAQYGKGLAILRKCSPAAGMETATLLNNMAVLLVETDRAAEALPDVREALSLWEAALGSEHPLVAKGLFNLAGLYCKMSRWKDAVPPLEQALRIAGKAVAPEDPLHHDILLCYSGVLRRLHRDSEARALDRRARAWEEAAVRNERKRHTVDVGELAALAGK